MVMRALFVSTVATGVLLFGLMGAHAWTSVLGTLSTLHRTPVEIHAGPTALPTTGLTTDAETPS
jgi:hypothetical protein